jgi:hypothetical protein
VGFACRSMSAAVPAMPPPGEAPVADEMERALSTVANLRRALAQAVSAAATDAVADAGDSEHDHIRASDSNTDTTDDPSLAVDELVTRLRALHSARDACVSQMRLEGAIREADATASALHAIPPSTLVEAPGEALERLEQGAAALKHAARALAQDQDTEESEWNTSRTKSAGSASSSSSSSALSVRFALVSATRAARCTETLRNVTCVILRNALSATGWPPNFDATSLRNFDWPLAGDDAVDPDDALSKSIAVLSTLRSVCAVSHEVFAEFQGAALYEARLWEAQHSSEHKAYEEDIHANSQTWTPRPAESHAWIGETLSAPICEKIQTLFGNLDDHTNLGDPKHPERMFKTVTRACETLVPIASHALQGLLKPDVNGAFSDEDVGINRELRGLVLGVARAASTLVGAKYVPACAAIDSEKDSKSKKKSVFANVTSYAKGDKFVQHVTPELNHTHWLHLADSCALFDLEIKKVLESVTEGLGNAGDSDSWEIEIPHHASALARLASTSLVSCERWFAAERGDAQRGVDLVCGSGTTSGDAWTPCGIGAIGLGYEEGDVDPIMEKFTFGGEKENAQNNDAPVSLPAADAVCDAVRAAVERALSLPYDTRVPSDGLGDLVGVFHGRDTPGRDSQSSENPNGQNSNASARLAFLESVAAPLVDTFLVTVKTRANSHDVFGSLATGTGVGGMTKMGHCVSHALRVAAFLADFSESRDALSGFAGANVFQAQIESLTQSANGWTDVLVDACFGAFVFTMVGYESTASLRSFGDGPGYGFEPTDVVRTTETLETPLGTPSVPTQTSSVPGTETPGQQSPPPGSVPGSSSFVTPVDHLYARLAGLRGALLNVDDVGDKTRVVPAVRTLGRLIARRFVTHVVMRTSVFSQAGAKRLGADVASLVGAFCAYAVRNFPNHHIPPP